MKIVLALLACLALAGCSGFSPIFGPIGPDYSTLHKYSHDYKPAPGTMDMGTPPNAGDK